MKRSDYLLYLADPRRCGVLELSANDGKLC
jgi:hypothetical protein